MLARRARDLKPGMLEQTPETFCVNAASMRDHHARTEATLDPAHRQMVACNAPFE